MFIEKGVKIGDNVVIEENAWIIHGTVVPSNEIVPRNSFTIPHYSTSFFIRYLKQFAPNLEWVNIFAFLVNFFLNCLSLESWKKFLFCHWMSKIILIAGFENILKNFFHFRFSDKVIERAKEMVSALEKSCESIQIEKNSIQ